MLDIVMYKIRRRNKAIQELVNVKPYLARYTILRFQLLHYSP